MKYLLSILIVMAFIGCSTVDVNNAIVPPVVNTNMAGCFGVQKISGSLNKSLEDSIIVDDTVKYELGDLKTSQSYSFILANTGVNAIESIQVTLQKSFYEDTTGIQVEIDSIKANYEVTPNRISILQANLVTAALKLSIIHGKALNGVGYTPILKPGTHIANVLITGKTHTYDGVDTTVSLILSVVVEAKVVSANFYSIKNDSSMYNYPTNSLSGSAEPYAGTKYFNGISLTNIPTKAIPSFSRDTVINGRATYYTQCYPVFVKNIGNTPMVVTVYSYQNGNPNISVGSTTYVIEVGSSELIAPPMSDAHVVVSVGYQNTTTDLFKMPLQADGNFYLCFTNG